MVTALWAVLLSFLIVLMQFSLLYCYKDSLTHVPVSCTIYYNIQVLRNSKSSLLSTGGISYWERSACDLALPQGEICGIFPTSCKCLHRWSTTVIDWNSHKLQWWHNGRRRNCLQSKKLHTLTLREPSNASNLWSGRRHWRLLMCMIGLQRRWRIMSHREPESRQPLGK